MTVIEQIEDAKKTLNKAETELNDITDELRHLAVKSVNLQSNLSSIEDDLTLIQQAIEEEEENEQG